MRNASLQKLLIVLILPLFSLSCGMNIFDDFVEVKTDDARLAEAKKAISEDDFTKAQKNLDNIEHRNSDYFLLQAVVYLGASGFSLWRIFIDTAGSLTGAGESASNTSSTNSTSDSSDGGGMSSFFNALSGENSVFGDKNTKPLRLAGLAKAIEVFEQGGQDFSNMRCLLSGVLLLPTVSDSTIAVDTALTSLSALEAELSGVTAGSCPDLTPLTNATTALGTIQKNLALITEQTKDCKILSFLSETGSLNQIQVALEKFITNADKGCDIIAACGQNPICRALQSDCVRSLLASDQALAGDGRVEQCEILQNCAAASSCF